MKEKGPHLTSQPKWKKAFSLKGLVFGSCFILIIWTALEIQDDTRKFGKFRTMQDPLPVNQTLDVRGLKELKTAGGPLLNFADLNNHYGSAKLFVVNVSSHNYLYINGVLLNHVAPSKISWLTPFKRLYYLGSLTVKPEQATTEKEEAEKHGYTYVDLPFGNKRPPPDEKIDAVVQFLDSLPSEAYVFYHCRHGKGRTSMLLVMSDIMQNAPQVALTDIVKRQHLLGSVDVFDVAVWKKGTYTEEVLKSRKAFIEKFYQFVCQRKNGGFSKWSAWHAQWKSLYENG